MQSQNEIYTAFENIYPVLQEFRKAASGPQPAPSMSIQQQGQQQEAGS